MATLPEIRAQFPQYNDMSDGQLLDALHKRFYSDLPRDEFAKRVGVEEPSTLADFGGQIVRGINRGMNSIVALPGEIFGGAINMVAPGQGDRFKWNNAFSRFMTSPDAQPKTTAGRYANSVGEVIGSSIVPSAGLLSKAKAAAQPALTTLGHIGNEIVDAYRVAPGATLGRDAITATGAGIGQQAARDLDGGPVGQVVGGFLGGMAPIGALSAASWTTNALNRSPVIARFRFQPQIAAEETVPQSAGAAVNPNIAPRGAPPTSSAEAAAYQHLANRLSEANVRPEMLERRLNQADNAAVGGPSPLALVDLDNSLQRLAGSVVRQSQEAGNYGQRFVAGRQTGITPIEGMPDAGIKTRQFMEAPNPIDPAAGMFERMRDNVRTALNVSHRSAYRTDQELLAQRRAAANQHFGSAYQAFDGVDLRPYIQPVIDRWRAIATNPDTPSGTARLIEQALRQFHSRTGNAIQSLRSFQRAKEFLDDDISKLMSAVNGTQRARGGMLNEIQREMLAAIDNIPQIGQTYAYARGQFGSVSEMREALELGRAALREGTEVSADAYLAMTPGQQDMFRVGLADAIERTMAAQKRGADVTQMFQSPRVQELMTAILPQNAAMRLGRNIQTENMTTRTAQEVFGNSKAFPDGFN